MYTLPYKTDTPHETFPTLIDHIDLVHTTRLP